jgi:hypothetical protein
VDGVSGSFAQWVGVLGIIYLVVGVLGFVVPSMFGLILHGYTVFDNLLHLALGIISIALGFLGGAGTARTKAWRKGWSSSLERGSGPFSSCPYSPKCVELESSEGCLGHEEGGVVATLASPAGSSRSWCFS